MKRKIFSFVLSFSDRSTKHLRLFSVNLPAMLCNGSRDLKFRRTDLQKKKCGEITFPISTATHFSNHLVPVSTNTHSECWDSQGCRTKVEFNKGMPRIPVKLWPDLTCSWIPLLRWTGWCKKCQEVWPHSGIIYRILRIVRKLWVMRAIGSIFYKPFDGVWWTGVLSFPELSVIRLIIKAH